MITVKIGGAVQKYKNILMFNLKNKHLIDGLQMIYYDMPNSCVWNGGRINRNVELTQNIIDTFNQQKMGIDLGFTNQVIIDVGDETGNHLLELLYSNNPNNLHGVILVSETLRRYLRKNFPNFKLTYSITGHPTTDQLNFEGYYKELEEKYDIIVPKYSHLDSIIPLMAEGKLDGSKYEILVNDNCNVTCQFYSEHFAQISFLNSTIDTPWESKHDLSYQVEIKPKIKSGPIKKEPNCVQGDLKVFDLQRFYDIGVRNFKISGRDLDDVDFEHQLPKHLQEIQSIKCTNGQ
jgi:hypothetical protein